MMTIARMPIAINARFVVLSANFHPPETYARRKYMNKTIARTTAGKM